jgi:cellulose biosynthesis protein BcsQ
MKIACVDKTASDRLNLQEFLERTLEDNREFIGYYRLADIIPLSKDELFLSSSIDAVAIGPAYSLDDALMFVRQLRDAEPNSPVFIFLHADYFSVTNLQRFERFKVEVFRDDEYGPRLANFLLGLVSKQVTRELGKLIVVDGAKGGVGVTSVVSGLAHAAQSNGQSSVVIDLSPSASLLRYCSTERWQSSEYTSLLVDRPRVSTDALEKLLVIAPNEIHFLLPPAGGAEVRELWLRDQNSFEVTLEIVTRLCEHYDVVIADLSRAEGILPFALISRADTRLLVTSNEAASVHLLGLRLPEFADIPGRSEIVAVVNELNESGLSLEDITAYLRARTKRLDISWLNHTIPHDVRARFWMGTTNSFYTEARRGTQKALESALHRICGGEVGVAEVLPEQSNNPLRRLAESVNIVRKPRLFSTRYLPAPPKSSNDVSVEILKRNADSLDFDFEPPRLIANNSGSIALESLLLFAAGMAAAIIALPELLSAMQIYMGGFTE